MNGGAHPLWLPDSTLTTLAEEAAELLKADGVSRQAQKVQQKLGSLFSMYHALWSNMISWGATEKPRVTPTHKFLREAARQSLVDRLILNARAHQVRHVSRRVVTVGKQKGWAVRPKSYDDPMVRSTRDQLERSRAMEGMLVGFAGAGGMLNAEVHGGGIRDVFLKALQGELIIDRKVMVTPRNSAGIPVQYHLLPPDDIKPRFEVLLRMIQSLNFPPQWTQAQKLDRATGMVFEKFGVDVSTAAYVQEIEGRVMGAWAASEISVDVTSPSDELNRWGYGVSDLEHSLEATTMLLLGWNYNKRQFTVNWPEAFLVFDGPVDSDGLEAFKRQIYAEVGQQGHQQLPVIATGGAEYKAQLLRLRDSMKDMQFMQMIRMAIALKCAAYRAHPSLVNFAPDAGGQRPIINNETQEQQIALAQEEGLHSVLANLSDWFTRILIEPWQPDLEMVFNVQDQPTDVERINIWTAKLAMGATVDEWRAQEGLPPLAAVTNGRVDGAYANSPFFFQQGQTIMQEQMLAAGMNPFGQQGAGGGGGGGGQGEGGQGGGDAEKSQKSGVAGAAEKSLRIVYVDAARDEDEEGGDGVTHGDDDA
jgi:hypothetical protein